MSRDVYIAIGYDKENDKKAIQILVPEKYKLRFGDVKFLLGKWEEIFTLHPDTVLLKEPGLYCILLRCKRGEAEPFMEWVVETVLPREVQNLSSVTEERDMVIAHRESQIQGHQQEVLRLNEEINDLIGNKYVARRESFDNMLCFIKKSSEDAHPYYFIRCQYRQLGKHKTKIWR